MSFSTFQADVAARLSSASWIGSIAVVQDDGTYPKSPALEASLRDVGIAITVMLPTGVEIVDTSSSGHAYVTASVKIAIDERVSFNRGASGTNKTASEVLELAIARMLGSLGGSNPNSRVLLHSPFQGFNGDGVLTYGFEVSKKFSFQPA